MKSLIGSMVHGLRLRLLDADHLRRDCWPRGRELQPRHLGRRGHGGTIKENKATVLQVFRFRVNDSGANGTRGDSDDRTFATQGIYIP